MADDAEDGGVGVGTAQECRIGFGEAELVAGHEGVIPFGQFVRE
ncbi:hypothetical protein [Streptomyces sp. N50]|nr:hypothetical protein [Streptomyces sp. N50]WOX16050.1 hypothetical protein R2B38_45145 [Streptomyces sp. N50]